MDIPRRRVAATPRARRGYSAETGRGDAAAATRTFGDRRAPQDSIAELTNNIFLNADGTNAPQEHVRMPDYTKSIRA